MKTMKALISTTELREAGYRVAQVEEDENTFPVSSDMFWVACSVDTKADQKWYDPADQQFKDFPTPDPEPKPQPQTEGTQSL